MWGGTCAWKRKRERNIERECVSVCLIASVSFWPHFDCVSESVWVCSDYPEQVSYGGFSCMWLETDPTWWWTAFHCGYPSVWNSYNASLWRLFNERIDTMVMVLFDTGPTLYKCMAKSVTASKQRTSLWSNHRGGPHTIQSTAFKWPQRITLTPKQSMKKPRCTFIMDIFLVTGMAPI